MTRVVLSENWYGELEVFDLNDKVSDLEYGTWVAVMQKDFIYHDIKDTTKYLYVDETEYGGDFSEHENIGEAIKKGREGLLSFQIYDRDGNFVVSDNDSEEDNIGEDEFYDKLGNNASQEDNKVVEDNLVVSDTQEENNE